MYSEINKNIIAAPLVVAGTTKVSLVISNDKREVLILLGSYHLAGYVSPPAINALERIKINFDDVESHHDRVEKNEDLLRLYKDPNFLRAAKQIEGASEALSQMLYNAKPEDVYSLFQKHLVLRKEGPPTQPIEFTRGSREFLDKLCYAIMWRYANDDGVLRITGQISDNAKVVSIEYQGSDYNQQLIAELCKVAKTDFVYVGFDQRAINDKDRPGQQHRPTDWERYSPPILYRRHATPQDVQTTAGDIVSAWCANHGIVTPEVPVITRSRK